MNGLRIFAGCLRALALAAVLMLVVGPIDAFQTLAPSQLPIATNSTNGAVHPDASTINVDGTGKLIAATQLPALSSDANYVYSSESFDIKTNGLVEELPNATSTGTTNNYLAKLSGSSAIIVATTDTDGIVGIVVAGGGTSGNAKIAITGQAICQFDGATTAGDWVGISSATAGECHDMGSATRGAGAYQIGRVLSTNGSAGLYSVLLDQQYTPSGGGSGSVNISGTPTANQIGVWTNSNTLKGVTPGGDASFNGTNFTVLAENGHTFPTSATAGDVATVLPTGMYQDSNILLSSLASLSVADQTLSGGANLTAYAYSTGSITVDCGKNPVQYVANTGAFTINAPSNDGACDVQIENGSGAGAVTFSGFSEGANTGDPLDTTSGHKFVVGITRIHGTSHYAISAVQ